MKTLVKYNLLSIVFITPAIFSISAKAADRYWACDSNSWDTTCWSSTSGGSATFGQPQSGDTVYLRNTTAVNKTISFANTAYPSAVLPSLTLDTAGSGSIRFFQERDVLKVTNEYIAQGGKATYSQSGGVHTVSSNLIIGAYLGGHGNYELSDSGQLSASFEYIGYAGTGTFAQSGGTHAVNNSQYSHLTLGHYLGSSGSYNLSGTGSLFVRSEVIGNKGTGTFTQSNGTHIATSISLGASAGGNGTYHLTGGSLSANTEIIAALDGVGGFIQDGGTNTVKSLHVGSHQDSSGTYVLNGGNLNADNEYVSGYFQNSNGTFTQDSGTNTITGNLHIAYIPSDIGGVSGTGIYNLNGGSLTVGRIFKGQNGVFNWTAGKLKFTQAHTIGAGLLFENLTVDKGKSLETKTLNISYGSLTIDNADSFATDNLNIDEGGNFAVMNEGEALISGELFSKGNVRVENSILRVDGDLRLNGSRLESNHSAIIVGNLVYDGSSSVVSSDDEWHVHGDFLNYSWKNAEWDTTGSSLHFEGAYEHVVSLAGTDKGQSALGFSDNFAWGSIFLAENAGLTILDSNHDENAALYVGVFRLGGGLEQLLAINSNFNIYYDSTLADNAYLNGKTYALNGSGSLKAYVSSVPLPAASWFMGTSLLGLIAMFRSRK
jgi:hypothetical protein